MIKIATIHRRILSDKIREIEKSAPEIQKDKMIREFLGMVNKYTFKERFNIAWRVLRGKL